MVVYKHFPLSIEGEQITSLLVQGSLQSFGIVQSFRWFPLDSKSCKMFVFSPVTHLASHSPPPSPLCVQVLPAAIRGSCKLKNKRSSVDEEGK